MRRSPVNGGGREAFAHGLRRKGLIEWRAGPLSAYDGLLTDATPIGTGSAERGISPDRVFETYALPLSIFGPGVPDAVSRQTVSDVTVAPLWGQLCHDALRFCL